MTVMSAPFGLFQQHISLMHGWVPTTVQALAAAALLVALTGRRRRWLPLAALLGVVAVAAAHWAIASNGLASEPAPRQLWLWVAASGVAVGVVGLGWRAARWSPPQRRRPSPWRSWPIRAVTWRRRASSDGCSSQPRKSNVANTCSRNRRLPPTRRTPIGVV